jgi:phospholipase C
LIVWDDWGGWYDHVNPIATIGGGNLGYPNGTGEQYVYGFRVPLLVVSEWVNDDSPLGGHISNVNHDSAAY